MGDITNLKLRLINGSTSYQIYEYEGEPNKLVIPDLYQGLPITSISSGTFKGCNTLTSVHIPSSVDYIGSYAFADCSNLDIDDINQVFSRVLYEFPIEQININFPRWVDTLENTHWLKVSLYASIMNTFKNVMFYLRIILFKL